MGKRSPFPLSVIHCTRRLIGVYVSTKYGRGVIARFTIDHLLAPVFLLNGGLVAREPLFDLLLKKGGISSV